MRDDDVAGVDLGVDLDDPAGSSPKRFRVKRPRTLLVGQPVSWQISHMVIMRDVGPLGRQRDGAGRQYAAIDPTGGR